MSETLGDSLLEVSFKLGNRTDLLQPVKNTNDFNTINGVTIGSGGTNYQVGDVCRVFQSGNAYGGLVEVATVNPNTGAILTLNKLSGGFLYTAASGLSLVGGNGSGATVNITITGQAWPSRIDLWLRDAYKNLLTETRFPGTEMTVNFTLVQGVDRLAYPVNARALETLTLYRSDGTVITVETKDIKYIRRMNSTNQSAPSMWAEFGSGVVFRPVPDNNGPYTCTLDLWQKPLILNPISSTPNLMPEDWKEVLEYSAAVRGHADLQEDDKAKSKLTLLYGSRDPATGSFTPGLISNLQNRIQASAPFKDWGVQPKGATIPFTAGGRHC